MTRFLVQRTHESARLVNCDCGGRPGEGGLRGAGQKGQKSHKSARLKITPHSVSCLNYVLHQLGPYHDPGFMAESAQKAYWAMHRGACEVDPPRGASFELDYGIGLAYAPSNRLEATARLRRTLSRDPKNSPADEARAVPKTGVAKPAGTREHEARHGIRADGATPIHRRGRRG